MGHPAIDSGPRIAAERHARIRRLRARRRRQRRHDGAHACARLWPARAARPRHRAAAANVRAIERMCLREPKVGAVVEPMQAGLGAVNETVGLPMDRQGRIQLQIKSWDPGRNRGESSYSVLTIDDLFLHGTRSSSYSRTWTWKLRAPHAARRWSTLARDRPIVAIETYEAFLPLVYNETRAAFEHLSRMFVVDEHVGGIKDAQRGCRAIGSMGSSRSSCKVTARSSSARVRGECFQMSARGSRRRSKMERHTLLTASPKA